MNQKGQIALVVLLLSAVMLTIGLAVAQRGLFDVKVSEQEEQASRAFQAAETGVEQGLRTLTGTLGDVAVTSGVSYNVTVSKKGGDGLLTDAIPVGDAVEVDLKGFTATAVDIYFRQKTDSCADSGEWGLEVEIVQDSGARVTYRSLYMNQPTDRNTFQGTAFCKRVADFSLTQQPSLVKLRVRPVGRMDAAILPSGTLLGFLPKNGTFPGQYQLIRSEGKTQEGITRAVNVTRTAPQLLTIFDYALFSGGGLQKAKSTYPQYVPDPNDFQVTSSIPQTAATWPGGPVNVVAVFNMELDPTSTITVKGPTPATTDQGSSSTTFDDTKTMRRLIKSLTVGGTYSVEWKACVPSGGCKTSSYTFTVTPPVSGYTTVAGDTTVKLQSTQVNGSYLDFPKLIMSKGKKVTFKNKTSNKKRVITDYHPDHQYVPAFKTGILDTDQTDNETLNDPGVYYYHVDNKDDVLVPGYEGIIIVK